MYAYINGVIKEIDSNYIVLENNDIGYLIYTASPYSFKIEEQYKIYLYQNVKEDELTLYGFKSTDEKNLFLKLINVKGLGCKMALPLLATEVSNVINAIEKEDINYLKKFPKIGDKVARQIILDLKGKLVTDNNKVNSNEELVNALVALGYKNTDVKKIIPLIKEEKLEDQIKEALKLMLR